MLACPVGAQLQPGDLDPTFNSTGVVVTDLGFNDFATDVAATCPDGKLVVVGESRVVPGPGQHLPLVRYLADGSLDPMFGTGGIATPLLPCSPSSPSGSTQALAVGIQEDCKIVVTGALCFGVSVARFNVDGSFDLSFGGDGVASVGSGVAKIEALGIMPQPDGRIVVGGRLGIPAVLARFMPDGTPDPSFGTGGLVSGFGFPNSAAIVHDLALYDDGRIVVAGNHIDLARFLPNGDLDVTFGGDGIINGLIYADEFLAVLRDSQDRIVATGGVTSPAFFPTEAPI